MVSPAATLAETFADTISYKGVSPGILARLHMSYERAGCSEMGFKQGFVVRGLGVSFTGSDLEITVGSVYGCTYGSSCLGSTVGGVYGCEYGSSCLGSKVGGVKNIQRRIGNDRLFFLPPIRNRDRSGLGFGILSHRPGASRKQKADRQENRSATVGEDFNQFPLKIVRFGIPQKQVFTTSRLRS